ncbi:HIT domain-containing protein [Conexibacter sp. W3-3-2]|uniref:HIT family protein n=1 Tax=Paraconexibacter algicola TaxID=2133960 RepID=A0A2T4UEZ2_9ACTN|nr:MULTISPECIES: HIT family protein [Solirubrobacterales]MTD47076.1 HIT domain-containing protein [Conexibacter sp. W3-3-2]PTL56358.1 HIT family protein [Paraconexibacter algicola]
MPADPDCIFCKIVAGDLPSTTIAETERAIAFMDINPGTRGHALVIPREHSRDLLEIAPDDLAACASLAQEIAGRAKDRLGADGVNLLNCCGADAWQTVFHFHLHVIPRYKDQPEKDALRLPWVPAPGDMDDIAAAGKELS